MGWKRKDKEGMCEGIWRYICRLVGRFHDDRIPGYRIEATYVCKLVTYSESWLINKTRICFPANSSFHYASDSNPLRAVAGFLTAGTGMGWDKGIRALEPCNAMQCGS